MQPLGTVRLNLKEGGTFVSPTYFEAPPENKRQNIAGNSNRNYRGAAASATFECRAIWGSNPIDAPIHPKRLKNQ